MKKFKKSISIMSLVVLVATMIYLQPVTVSQAAEYNLIWSDEFNSTSLNRSNWTYEVGTGSGGWGNNELEYYTSRPENISVSDGELRITARKENYNGSSYTSARIKTQGLKNFKYGRIEARIRLPKGKGLWPAFWMLGSNFSSVGWPYCGEIDIMEHINTENNVHGTIHWDYNGYANYGTASGYVDVTQYHVYAIEWNEQSIKWFVDGVQYLEANIANNINGTEEFHKDFFLILNLAVGGNWPGSPDASTPFPSTMSVDYIRVYQMTSNPSVIDFNKTYFIRANGNNRLLCAENYGNDPILANRTVGDTWESFQFIQNGDGTVSIRSKVNNKYVCADLNTGNQALIANRTVIDAWEKFYFENLGNGNFALKAMANNKYVQVDINNNNVVRAAGNSIGTWETFSFGN
ncbi:MAG: glycosyl hydrolase family protein [Anaerolineaceae bacterium]|nr:MAG: glycosyl hydrolase family protein [Anaerolineaceae bacterium]